MPRQISQGLTKVFEPEPILDVLEAIKDMNNQTEGQTSHHSETK